MNTETFVVIAILAFVALVVVASCWFVIIVALNLWNRQLLKKIDALQIEIARVRRLIVNHDLSQAYGKQLNENLTHGRLPIVGVAHYVLRQ
jgi:hypothetical protein